MVLISHADMFPDLLQSRLAAALPKGLNLHAYHLSTPPTSTEALFAAQVGREEETTTCESHFLAVSSPEHDDKKEVFIFAIEVLLFTTNSLTTLFVSKADSSGFASRFNLLKGSSSVVATITTVFIEYLLEPRLTSSRVVVSLFARSQKQYLFPGSSENAGKHILDDRQLIKWWCRVFDLTLRLPRKDSTTTAHLLVPGCDKAETKAFFPPSSRRDLPSTPKWINSYPVELMVTESLLPPRYLLPRLPDDPKMRFLDDLDGELVDENGNWRSVKNLDQFWEFLSHRQECSAGRLVGFLWLFLSQGQTKPTSPRELQHTNDARTPPRPMARSRLITPVNSQQLANGFTDQEAPAPAVLELLPDLNSSPPSSPIQAPDQAPSPQPTHEAEAPAEPESPANMTFSVVRETQGEVVINTDLYQALMDYLLQTDFAGENRAIEATKSWIDRVFELSGATSFGRPVLGCATPILPQTTAAVDSSLSSHINVLTGIRKKRKADVTEDGTIQSDPQEFATAPIVNIIASGLLRKKPKG